MKLAGLLLCLLSFSISPIISIENSFDIVVYGGTSAGVIAAIQGSRMGKSVLLIEPGKHLGGMTSSGLGWVDVKNLVTIGGLTKDYFHRVWQHYQQEDSWNWEQKHPMTYQFGKHPPKGETMWVVEPHVAEHLFDQMVAEVNVSILLNERLNRNNGVTKEGTKILSIALESGLVIHGLMFIDASYEGDLMASSGISYFIGRECNSIYNETINGIQSNLRRSQMPKKIDPYRIKGDPNSGLLSRVYLNAGGADGMGDKGIQAYNYRMCLTDVLENQVKIEKPEGYDEDDYELVFRAIEEGMKKEKFFKLDPIPNRKTDSNNNGPVSTDYVGMSWEYPEADYATRKKIALEHERWQRGLVWTLQNHSRIPEDVKQYYAPWGLPKDEFIDNNNWPHQIYIREARRMISEIVITEQTALGKDPAHDSIALGSYHLDSHYIKYCVAPDGYLITDGGLYKNISTGYPISYRSIVPFQDQCENLLVPICLSATHVAYSSIRMEPVFMIIGQSAATAASLAIDFQCKIQEVPYEILRERLITDSQVLQMNP